MQTFNKGSAHCRWLLPDEHLLIPRVGPWIPAFASRSEIAVHLPWEVHMRRLCVQMRHGTYRRGRPRSTAPPKNKSNLSLTSESRCSAEGRLINSTTAWRAAVFAMSRWFCARRRACSSSAGRSSMDCSMASAGSVPVSVRACFGGFPREERFPKSRLEAA